MHCRSSSLRRIGVPMADNDDIPFNRNFPLKPGVVEEVRPGVRRVLCDNPSPFTFTGTVSYMLGKGKVSIIDAGADRDFRPDIAVNNGDVIEGDGWRLEAVATPGHTANHLAFAWPERKINFVGDHVMGWSTSIVAPPDGSMVDYMASLERLTTRGEDLYFSGHGPEIQDGPRYVRFLIRHRHTREASILHRLSKGEADIPTIVRAVYIGIDPRLTTAAGYSVLAHLEDLVGRGIVTTDGDSVIGGTYRLAH